MRWEEWFVVVGTFAVMVGALFAGAGVQPAILFAGAYSLALCCINLFIEGAAEAIVQELKGNQNAPGVEVEASERKEGQR